MKKLLPLLVLLVVVSLKIQATQITSYPAPVVASGFIKNEGQFSGTGAAGCDDVLFVYSADDFRMILRNSGFSYELCTAVPINSAKYESGYSEPSTFDRDEDIDRPERMFSNRVDVSFSNRNKNMSVEGMEQLPYYFNYFTNKVSLAYVAAFQKVYYHDVYKGIDLVFYFSQDAAGKHTLKYDWIIRPEGDAGDIALCYRGENAIRLQKDGSLMLETEIGHVSESTPVSISSDQEVKPEASYQLKGNILTYKTGKNLHKGFVIDPVISWGIDLGGTKTDMPDEIAFDAYENVYMCGRTRSNSISFQGQTVMSKALKNAYDAFLAKFDANSNLLWCTYYGGAGDEKPFAITLDPQTQEVFIAGKTTSDSGIAFNCIDDPADYTMDGTYDDNFDGFVAKFTTSGEIIRSTYVGGPMQDYFLGLVCYTEPNGNVVLYASGTTESSTGIVRPSYTGVEQYTYSGGDDKHGDVMLIKFNQDLSERIWGTYYGKKQGEERSHELTVDYRGFIYVTGTMSGDFSGLAKGTNVFQGAMGGLADAFLSQWNGDGTLNWLTFFGGKQNERGRDVKTDLMGNIYFVGKTTASSTYPNCMVSSSGVVKALSTAIDTSQDLDGFIAKFNDQGERLWSTFFGGSNYDDIRAISVSPLGSPIYISGYTLSDDLPVTDDAYDKTSVRGEYYFAKINYNATRIMYCTYYGGTGEEGGVATQFPDWYNGVIEVDFQSGNVYCASATNSKCDIEPGCSCSAGCTSGGYGDYDAFLVKFTDPCGNGNDAFEPNDTLDFSKVPMLPFSPDNVITCNATINFEGSAKYIDCFGFTVSGNNNHLKIILTQPPGFPCVVTLIDASGMALANGGKNDLIEADVVAGNSYFVSVNNIPSSNLDSSESCYTLQLTASNVGFRSEPAAGNETDRPFAFIYPNPSQQTAQLHITNGMMGRYDVTVFDITGKMMSKGIYFMPGGENTIGMNLSQLAAGPYSVSVSSPLMQQHIKLIVAK